MQFILPLLAMATFTSALSGRSLDPVLPKVAADLLVTVPTAALAASAMAFTYACVQPVLGNLGDHFGKPRIIGICLFVASAGNIIAGFATSFEVLLIGKILCGIGGGGVMPVALGLIGDLFPLEKRQVAMSRVTAGASTGFLLGTTFSGIVGEHFGWRTVLLMIGIAITITGSALVWTFRNFERPPDKELKLQVILETYRKILLHPHARICFAAVMTQGLFVQGLFPFIAKMLEDLGQPSSTIAGLVIAGFPIGALCYTLTISRLLPVLKESGLFLLGGLFLCSQLVFIGFGPPWQVHFFIMFLMGWGFLLVQGSLHSFVSEIAPATRGAALSLHMFSMFTGIAIGPIFYGTGFELFGKTPTMIVAGCCMLVTSVSCSRLLKHKPRTTSTGSMVIDTPVTQPAGGGR